MTKCEINRTEYQLKAIIHTLSTGDTFIARKYKIFRSFTLQYLLLNSFNIDPCS